MNIIITYNNFSLPAVSKRETMMVFLTVEPECIDIYNNTQWLATLLKIQFKYFW